MRSWSKDGDQPLQRHTAAGLEQQVITWLQPLPQQLRGFLRRVDLSELLKTRSALEHGARGCAIGENHHSVKPKLGCTAPHLKVKKLDFILVQYMELQK